MKQIPRNTCERSWIANELRALQRVDHPNLIRFIEAFRDRQNYYIVTEYCKGGELFSHVLDKVQLSDTEACWITQRLCHTLDYLHKSALICHRDLKPENILFTQVSSGSHSKRRGSNPIEIKVIDFGLSKLMQD